MTRAWCCLAPLLLTLAGCSLEPFVPYDGGVLSDADAEDRGTGADGATFDGGVEDATAEPGEDAAEPDAEASDRSIEDGNAHDAAGSDATRPDATRPDAANADASNPDAPAPGSGRIAVYLAGSGRDLGAAQSADGRLRCPGSCFVDVAGGVRVALTATVSLGARFGAWAGCSAAGTACEVTATAGVTQTATATFDLEPVTLSVTYSGSGDIDTAPAGLTCNNGTCSGAFDYGTTVDLAPQPANGWGFGHFLDPACQVTSCRLRLAPASSPFVVRLSASFSEALVANYPFETDGSDGSRHGHHASPAIGVSQIQGRVGGGARFSGSAGTPYVVANSAELFENTALTVCAFIRPGTGNGSRQVVVQKSGSYALSVDGSGAGVRTAYFDITVASGLGGTTLITLSGPLPLAQDWNHVCGRYQAGVASAEVAWLLLDGRVVATKGGLATGNVRGDTSPLSLGGCVGCSTTNFDGSLDEARIWLRTLPDIEITAEGSRR